MGKKAPASPPQSKRHYCYCLESEDKTRTYVGYTTNIFRRLRQHNSELVGGAASTRGRRWNLLYLIGGLPNGKEARRLEYFLHHLRASSVKRNRHHFLPDNICSVIPKARLRRAIGLADALETPAWTRKQEIPVASIPLRLETGSDFLALVQRSLSNRTLPGNVSVSPITGDV
jgi:predicted GIY-YIG superfamily endonuclease